MTTGNGGCLCGAVTYQTKGSLRPVVACHCVQCRKTSGHHVAATAVARECLEINGQVSWYQSSPTARRGFCGTCGSNLFWDGSDPHISIFAGTLDGVTGLETAGHIYCSDKGDYYEIADETPQFPGDSSTLTTQDTP